jgi:hypothetical protein
MQREHAKTNQVRNGYPYLRGESLIRKLKSTDERFYLPATPSSPPCLIPVAARPPQRRERVAVLGAPEATGAANAIRPD